jgi:hypothetical protein
LPMRPVARSALWPKVTRWPSRRTCGWMSCGRLAGQARFPLRRGPLAAAACRRTPEASRSSWSRMQPAASSRARCCAATCPGMVAMPYRSGRRITQAPSRLPRCRTTGLPTRRPCACSAHSSRRWRSSRRACEGSSGTPSLRSCTSTIHFTMLRGPWTRRGTTQGGHHGDRMGPQAAYADS